MSQELNYRHAIARALADEMAADDRVILIGEDVGAAGGAAIMGLRPVAEIMFADFAGVCFDQIANQLAKYRYMTGGQVNVPVTIRMTNGAGAGFGAQHSQATENWFLNIPGLKIAVPGTVSDLYGLLRSATPTRSWSSGTRRCSPSGAPSRPPARWCRSAWRMSPAKAGT